MAGNGHAMADRRNLHLHRTAFAKLRTDSELRRPCVMLVERWLADPALESAWTWLRQWREMLADWPVERMEAVVLAEETGQVLRQCSPLGPVLTAQERWAALAEINQEAATSGRTVAAP